MKQFFLALFLCTVISSTAQEIILKRGIITDFIKVSDSTSETYSIYLPTNFDMKVQWPIVFVFDMHGHGRQAISMFAQAAEQQGYILASSNNVSDSLSLAENMLISTRMLNSVYTLLPIRKNRSYVAGFASGARFASLIPTFIKNIEGVISCGSPMANTEVLSVENPFHYIGIVGIEDFNYPDMVTLGQILDKLKFPNQLLVFDGGHTWPLTEYLNKALNTFTLYAMIKGNINRDPGFIERSYRDHLAQVGTFVTTNKPLLADKAITEMMEIYADHMDIDSLKTSRKILRRSSLFRSDTRNENSVLFKETLIKDDYDYYLDEDIRTYNFNNLGWWKYQMEELEKYGKSSNVFEKQMGARLRGYINALIDDNADVLIAEPILDLEALNFVYMLKTITSPKESKGYFNVISNSARMEDYGTALFYLEELLKNGYSDRASLYNIEHTALLRITPEFNEIIEKYLKAARYEVIER